MSDIEIMSDPRHSLWVEKYRPQRVQDCILPERIKKPFEKYLETGDFPTLLLSSGPGQGKTTLAKALCNELGLDWILINTSNERGIDVLRTTISNFATSVSLDGGIKCVILDEFDGASELLQKSLRAAIEDFSVNCRFIMTANYPNKIIDAIHSRSAFIELKINADEKLEIAKSYLNRACAILDLENVQYDKKAVVSIVQQHFPDFRHVLNELQKFAASGSIDVDTIKLSLHDVSVTKLIRAMRDGSFKDIRQWVASNAGSDQGIIFRRVYDSLVTEVKSNCLPTVIVTLNQYMHMATTALDPEINLTACFLELTDVAEFN